MSEVLDCLCWCERYVVQIPKSWVKQGKTMACKKAPCKEYDKKMREQKEKDEHVNQDSSK